MTSISLWLKTVHTISRITNGQTWLRPCRSLDDLLYWYCQGVVSHQAAELVGDRAGRFEYEYRVLSDLSIDWARRNVRETAEMFRRYGKPQDIALLPDIGEPL